MSGIAKIKLEKCNNDALPFIKKASQYHIQGIEIIDEINDADITVSLPESMMKPVRVGTIIDYIEKILFDHNYNIDVLYKDYHLNIRDNDLKIGKKSYPLSARETDLCAYLLRAGDKGCHRETLLNHVWGYRADLETHALETQIYRLRQKIEKSPDNPKIIVTIDGGYKFA